MCRISSTCEHEDVGRNGPWRLDVLLEGEGPDGVVAVGPPFPIVTEDLADVVTYQKSKLLAKMEARRAIRNLPEFWEFPRWMIWPARV